MFTKIHMIILLIITTLFLSSCFEVTTEINLKKDGSGILKQRVMFSQIIVSQMESLKQSMGSDGTSNNSPSMYDEEKAKSEASKYGERVEFLSGSELKENGKAGYEVFYSFKDIKTLHIGNDPSTVIDMGGAEIEREDLITFDFKKGKVNTLTIIMPEQDSNEEEIFIENSAENTGNYKSSEIDQKERDEIKKMLSGIKFSYKINIEGKITETDADNVEKSTITIMEIDFDKLMENPESFKNLETLKEGNPDKTMKAMKDMEGIKIEMKELISVKFK